MHVAGALALLVAVVASVCEAFPEGAPIEACIYGNKPNHYGTKPKPPQDSKVKFFASDSYYEPGSIIYVHIQGGNPFKGFFVQARDAKTKEWIGSFQGNADLESYPECAAVTHKSRRPKSEVVLAWQAPAHGRGEVFFTGTVLENYANYWSDMVAHVPKPGRGRPHLG
ncbi:putative defense protein 1 [Scylla paramamosain]|uniref:putative defense protein 1 n=1 Tax=Scylla paramamosain TaxID=85552 RepID=UPI003083084B